MTSLPHRAHEDGPQPLPACLAPTDAVRAALPDLRMPEIGEQVVLHDGHVYWLATRLTTSPHTRRSIVLWAAPIRTGPTCPGAAWDDEALFDADPADPNLNLDERKVLRVAIEVLLEHANTTGTGTLFPRTDTRPTAPRGHLDPRVSQRAEAALEIAAKNLEQAQEPAGHLARSAFAVCAERRITDPDLIQRTIDACHAAIGLVLLTDYHRTGLIDRARITNPEATARAVRTALAAQPRELRPDLARRAAVKIAIYRHAD